MKQKFSTDFILDRIHEDRKDPRKAFMKTAECYYRGENDILKRKRFFIGANGEEIETKRLANSRISHPFFSKLVDQKTSYLLAKDMSINTENEAYAQHLETVFGRKFMRLLRSLGTEAIICAVAWLQVYHGENGEIAFKLVPSREVIPIWHDSDHLQLDGVIRYYQPERDSKVQTVEVYDAESMQVYDLDGDKLTIKDVRSLVSLDVNGAKLNASWGRVPFVPFRYNAREVPLLQYVKSAIDDYDEITSDLSNAIKDTPKGLRAVRGYTGANEEIPKFIHNLFELGVVFLDEGGSIETVQTSIETAAAETHLSRLRSDIYDAGCGVDAQQASMGNTSGVAIRLRYADLDMNCAAIGNEFAAALEELLYFVNIDAAARRIGNFDGIDVSFVFNTDVSVNEAETISEVVQSRDILSRKTLLANHPWVKSVEDELQALDEDEFGADIDNTAENLPSDEQSESEV